MGVKVVVVADGIAYKIAGQKEPEPPRMYVTTFANRGDEITVDESDAERFKLLGSVTEPGSREAQLAVAVQHRWGPPAGAAKLSLGENTPVDKIAQEAREMGLLRVQAQVAAEPEETGTSGEVAADFDATNKDALNALNVVQLKNLAKTRGVDVGSKATKATLVKDIAKHAKDNPPAAPASPAAEVPTPSEVPSPAAPPES